MRGAVAVVCALLPFMLFGSRPVAAQEPLRVIRELRFEGNRAIPDEVIASAIATTNSSWFARTFLFRWLGLGEKRYFDEQEFRRDVVRIEVLYRRSGYPQALVDTTVVRDPLNVFITFRIAEGPPVRVVKLATNGLDSLASDLRDQVLRVREREGLREENIRVPEISDRGDIAPEKSEQAVRIPRKNPRVQ